ncbi:MAG: hypothetical protein JWL64_1184 [Frankiales bacterium]|nr:hypothetical protein [Frankiales bacterium]
MDDDTNSEGIDPEQGGGGHTRRTVIRGAAAGLAGAWAVPVITSFTSPAMAAGSVPPPDDPNPECSGSSCANFIPCSSNADCVCGTTATGGGFCIPGTSACGSLTTCGAGNVCGPDQVCLIDTCCGRPVCIPIAANQGCPPSAPAGAAARSAPVERVSTGAGTLGG